jgi:riboflavin kinase / FMN adenylyltransferase
MDSIDIQHLPKIENSWVCIGSFDGVHLGHRALLKQLVEGARVAASKPVVVTFQPHPSFYFGKVAAGYQLTSSQDKEKLIHSQGVETILTLRFDQNLADLDAETFLLQLKNILGVRTIVAGKTFSVGKNRSGTISEVISIGSKLNFEVKVVEPFKIENTAVSSTIIRKNLQEGKMRTANQLLGRNYTISGNVIHGEHRGRRLGIPTANIETPKDRLIPDNGVYVTRAHFGTKTYPSVTNIGVRPTFENPLPTPRIEIHLLDTTETLYDQEMTLEFIDYLRPEMKFPDAQQLVDQINLDIRRTREVLANEPHTPGIPA